LISGLGPPSRKESASYAYVIEVLEIIAGIIFVAGSICFLPQYSQDVDIFILGCNIFVVGSVQYVIISLLTLAEEVNEKGWWTFEATENCLWLLGSVIFLWGTIMYFPERQKCEQVVNDHAVKGHNIPDDLLSDHDFRVNVEKCSSLSQHMNKNPKEFWGTVFFITGSMIFAIAIFINALNQRTFRRWEHKMFGFIAFNYMLGSLLFCMGSIAFLPHVGCGPEMVELGAWMFIVGSLFYVVGSVASLRRTHYMLNKGEEDMSDADAEVLESRLSK